MILKLLLRKTLSRLYRHVQLIRDMNQDERATYIQNCRDLSRSPTLTNELAKLENHAKEHIIKKTKTDEEVAFYRGMLYAIEQLEHRLDQPVPIINKRS